MAELFIQFLVAFGATVGFAVLVNAPAREFIYTGITGGVGWLVYVFSLHSGLSSAFASLVAALALALLSRIFAVVRQCPATVFLISGIFALVPGTGVYYMAYYFIQGDSAAAFASGFVAFGIAVAIAVGIVLVMALPGRFFHIFHRGTGIPQGTPSPAAGRCPDPPEAPPLELCQRDIVPLESHHAQQFHCCAVFLWNNIPKG